MANDTNTRSFRFAHAQSAHESRDHHDQQTTQSASRQPEQGQALVETNLTRTVYQEFPDLPAVTRVARNDRTPATDETEGVPA